MTTSERKRKRARRIHTIRLASRRQREHRRKYRKSLFSDVMGGKY